MIEFGLYALTWENVHDMLLNTESRLPKNMNSMIKILIILVCKVNIWKDVCLYWETISKILHALIPSPDFMNSISYPRPRVPQIPSCLAFIISVPISPG